MRDGGDRDRRNDLRKPPHVAPAHRNGADFNNAEAVRRRKNRGKTMPPRNPGFQVQSLFKY